jgi:CAAX protease family protein
MPGPPPEPPSAELPIPPPGMAPPAAELPENPPWSFLDVMYIALAAVVFIFVLGALTLGIARGSHLFGGEPVQALARDPKLLVPTQAISYLFVVLFMAFLATRHSRSGFWTAVRWNWPAAWSGYLAAGVVMAYAITAASSFLPIPKQLPVDRYFHDAADAWLMAVFGVFVAPVVEELFYRGFLYPVLARRLGMVAGIALTALPFAFMHGGQLAFSWAPLLMLFIVGTALTTVRAHAGSVAASVLVHAGYNATLFALLFFATDHFRHLDRALE